MKNNFECYGRTHRTGDGVGLYILKDIEYKLRNDINTGYNNHMESIFVEIINKRGKNAVIGVIYWPPKSDVKEFLKDFNIIKNKVNL